MKRVLIFWTVALACAAAFAGEVFFWTDSDGIRHFSNVTPEGSTGRVERFDEDRSRYETMDPALRNGIRFTAGKIYDGDSLKVTGAGLTLPVRLVGIDAPETGGGKHPPQPFSREAKTALSGMILGKTFLLKSYGTGGYNRVLAELFVADRNVNLTLVRQGLAEVYRGRKPRDLDTDAYLSAQAEARRSSRGIWSLGSRYESPRDWRKRHPRR